MDEENIATLSQAVRALKKDGLVDFTTASATLSAAAKIYSCRVDAVHNETYRVLSDYEVKDEDLIMKPGDSNKKKKKDKNNLLVTPRDEWE